MILHSINKLHLINILNCKPMILLNLMEGNIRRYKLILIQKNLNFYGLKVENMSSAFSIIVYLKMLDYLEHIFCHVN